MISALRTAVESFIAREKLPPAYVDTVATWFVPLAEDVLRRAATSQRTLVVGISGSQGSGKSTLAALLVLLLKEMLGLRAVSLSIDDFYLTRAERQRLASEVHPLLATRGVPGTHDVALALQTLRALGSPGQVAIPRFDKACDDRAPRELWPTLLAPVDVVVLEGWCLAVPPQDAAALLAPVNELEAEEDAAGSWRRYVNDQVAGSYAEWFARVDYLVLLQAPSFERVYEWRQRQEDKLAARLAAAGQTGTRLMDAPTLRRFIQHYERLTRHGLEALPAHADVVYALTPEQTIAACRKGGPGQSSAATVA